MNEFIRNSLKTLSDSGLYLVYQDAMNRIGSHYPGGNPDFEYLKKQEAIISAIQEELENRNQKGALEL